MEYFFPATVTIYDLDISLIVTKTATEPQPKPQPRKAYISAEGDLFSGQITMFNTDGSFKDFTSEAQRPAM